MTSQTENQLHAVSSDRASTPIGRHEKLLAAGGVLGALAASSCCLVLFGLGISGAWIGNLTRLASYQPYFLTATAGCTGVGYWLCYLARKTACAKGDACARPLPNLAVTLGLILATVLVVAAVALDFLAPLFY